MHELPAAILPRLTFVGALNECLRHDGRQDQAIASEIHVSQSYFSKLLRGVWEAQIKRLIRFMRETRCIAPLQYICEEMGCEVTVRAPVLTEAERLRRENDELRRALARRVA